jgi:hypothetical protein
MYLAVGVHILPLKYLYLDICQSMNLKTDVSVSGYLEVGVSENDVSIPGYLAVDLSDKFRIRTWYLKIGVSDN